jgi:DNA-binding transcriptional ArsR family regulator
MLKEKAKIFQALSDPSRLRILKMLTERTLCVCEITSILRLAPSTVSKHLSLLSAAGFLLEEKSGKWVNYSINSESKNPLVLSLLTLVRYELNEDSIIKNDSKHAESVNRIKICCK